VRVQVSVAYSATLQTKHLTTLFCKSRFKLLEKATSSEYLVQVGTATWLGQGQGPGSKTLVIWV